MRPELIVAEKEFRDHVTSKRFIVIFGILMLLAIYAMTTGMDAYNKQLEQYKNPQLSPDYQFRQQNIDMYENMLQSAHDRNASAQEIESIQSQLDALRNPAMPSILTVFNSMILLFTFVGMILGAAMGFDQIARERDEGSLKLLVTSPVYRDAIVNGKTIGAIGTLAAAMAASFAITLAIVMLKGIMPGLEDLIRIFLFFIAALLYCTVFFAIAMMLSALSKNTTVAAITTVGMVFAVFIYTVLAAIAAVWIAQSIAGPPPVIDYSQMYPQTYPVLGSSADGNITMSATPMPAPVIYSNPYDDYYNRVGSIQSQISGILSAFSPIDDFSGYLGFGHPGIGTAMITKQNTYSYIYGPVSGTASSGSEMSLLDSLASIWLRVLVLIAEIAAAFGIAYIAFMRADIR